MRAALLGLSITLCAATLAAASEISVDNRSTFEAIVLGKELLAKGVQLQVLGDGTITGRAYGQRVSGSWSWDQVYFCRNLALGVISTPKDCARVTVDNSRITFITDRGRGKSAWLTLR